ncbi:hypothetical protein pb186bvf_013413 [Paramecium bursaria]
MRKSTQKAIPSLYQQSTQSKFKKAKPNLDNLDLVPEKQKPQQEVKLKTVDKVDDSFQRELQEIQNRELMKQRELDAFVQMQQKQLTSNEAINPNKHYEQINKKLDKMKKKMGPVLDHYQTKEAANIYPFTGNLLARSVSKLVQVHNEKITEMLIDDLLIDTAEMLNQIEIQQHEYNLNKRNNRALQDYIEAIQDLAIDQDQVEEKLNERKKMDMDQQAKIDQFTPALQNQRDKQFYRNPEERIRSIELSSGLIIKIIEDRKGRIKLIETSKDLRLLYSQKNLEDIRLIR